MPNYYGTGYYPYNYSYGSVPVYPQISYQQPQTVTMPQQTIQNPTQNQQISQTPQPASQSSIIWVSGEQEAQMFPIAPNNAVALWEKTGKTIYLKQADPTGKPTMTIYDLVERTTTPAPQQAPQPQIQPQVSYATKEDMTGAIEAMQDMAKLISTLKGELQEMKKDIYGEGDKS